MEFKNKIESWRLEHCRQTCHVCRKGCRGGQGTSGVPSRKAAKLQRGGKLI